MKRKIGIVGFFLGCALSMHVICFGAQSPEKISMIWYVGPSPAWTYMQCDNATGDANFCVPAGSWWGVCRDKQFGKSKKSLKQGTIKIDEGRVEFGGCPYYSILLSEGVVKKYGFRVEKENYWKEACSDEHRSIYQFDDSIYVIEIDNSKRQIGFLKEKVAPGKLSDLLIKKLPNMRWTRFDFKWEGLELEDAWRINDVFDLNGDKRPEIILSSGLKDFYPAAAALMISVGEDGKVEIMSKTINRPNLYLNSPEKKTVYLVHRIINSFRVLRGHSHARP